MPKSLHVFDIKMGIKSILTRIFLFHIRTEKRLFINDEKGEFSCEKGEDYFTVCKRHATSMLTQVHKT